MPTYGRLLVCEQAKKLTIAIYRCVGCFPARERFGISSQLTRAALSIGANIAEGQRRATTKDFRNFVHIAEGSLAELQYTLEIADELGYVPDGSFAPIWAQTLELERMLRALRQGLDNRIAKATG